MRIVFLVLYILVCIILNIIVLIQSGKGQGLAAALGGSSQSLFGVGSSKTFLSKITTGVAILFMVISLLLALLPTVQQVPLSSKLSETKTETSAPGQAKPAEKLPPKVGLEELEEKTPAQSGK